MVWEPFALAVVFGLVVSAGLYFIVMWPQVEPDDEADQLDAPAEAPVATVAAAPVAPTAIVTTADVATSADVATADDVVATDAPPSGDDPAA